MNKEIIYVVLPCYNEGSNIPNLIKEWKILEYRLSQIGFDLEIVVVNDGSNQETYDIVNRMCERYDNVKVLHHSENKGLGAAINTGINYTVSEKQGGYLCIMDGDRTHPPEFIFSMVDKLKSRNQDCVIASRYRKGSKIEGLSAYRKVLSLGARMLYTMRFGITGCDGFVRDYTCGYRLYRMDMLSSLVEKYDHEMITETGFACMVELLVKIKKAGYRICEVPFVLKYHLKDGESKMRIFRTVGRSLYLMMKF